MKARNVFFAIVLGVFVTSNPVTAATHPWAQYGKDGQNTAMVNYTGPSNTDYTWKVPLDNWDDRSFVSPVMDDSKTIYLFNDADGWVIDGNGDRVRDYYENPVIMAIHNTGAVKWTLEMDRRDCASQDGETSMALGNNGMLYVVCGGYNSLKLFAIDPAAEAISWSKDLTGYSGETIGNLTIDSNNKLYLTGSLRTGNYRDHVVMSLFDTGVIDWTATLGSGGAYDISGPVLSSDVNESTVYVYRRADEWVDGVYYRGARIHAINTSSGGQEWDVDLPWGGTGWQQFTTFTVDDSGTLWLASYVKYDPNYCYGRGEYLVGISSAGVIDYEFPIDGDLDCGSHIRVGPSGTIYITYDDQRERYWDADLSRWAYRENPVLGGLAAYDRDTGFKWRYELSDSYEANASPAIDAAENIYFAASYGTVLYSIDKDGQVNWQMPIAGSDELPYGVAPFIGADGSVYVMGSEYLYAVDNDVDKDGVRNIEDNCVVVANAGQADTNGNGIGDDCDGDFDSDGIKDINDNCPVNANNDQLDMDNDGVGFLCDPCPDDTTDPNNTCNDVAQSVEYPMTEDVTIENGDGSASVTVHAAYDGYSSSISANTEIEVTIEPNLENFGYGAGQHIISAYTFTASPSSDFNEPQGVTIVFNYEEPNAQGIENTLDIYWYDQLNSKWVAQNAIQDTDNNTLTVTVSHFSTYAVIANENPVIGVQVDIKPGSCPSPINVQEKGVIPVAILGSADLDVTQIDASSVKLNGVAALRSSLEDLASPSVDGACTEDGGDGYDDLVLKFDAQSVVQFLRAADGEELFLSVQGYLKEEFGNFTVSGEDVVVILNKGKQEVEDYPLSQWAATAIARSEYSSGNWSAWQATGEPNTFDCGDIRTAWAPRGSGTGPEWIELGFSTPVPATGLRVHETFETGFIYRVDLKDVNGGYHTVWTGTDTTGCPGWFELSFDQTDYLVEGVKLYTQINGWEEVDAVELIHEPYVKQRGGKGNK